MPSSDSGDETDDMSDSDLTDSSIESELEENTAVHAAASSSEQAGPSSSQRVEQPNKVEREEEKQKMEDNEEEEEEEDELVKAIKAELNKHRDHPPEIVFEDLIVDVSFHPCTNILAAASVTGDVFL